MRSNLKAGENFLMKEALYKAANKTINGNFKVVKGN